MSSSRTAIPSRQYSTSLMYNLPIRQMKEILSCVFPGITLDSAEEFRSTQLARLYTLNMSDGRRLLLSFAPSLTVRLLRHEGALLSSEAALVSFVAGLDQIPGSPKNYSSYGVGLRSLVPKLLKHSSNTREMPYQYSIFKPASGASLSTLIGSLSSLEQRCIDRQIGSLARELASLTSPRGTFGVVSRVIPDLFTTARTVGPEMVGSKTWSKAFHRLLEGILRDGEDIAVLLPYEAIRSCYKALSWRLDAVLSPRLVVLDVGSERNVMVERGSNKNTSKNSSNFRVVGLRSWSLGVFGDPLIADCFEDPSEGFLQGWREGGDDIIEDREGAEVRMMLYQCFTAAVGIVTEHYRPHSDSSGRELDARRRLTNALARLEKLDSAKEDTLKRKHSRAKEAEPSKRQKVEESLRDLPTLSM